MSTTLPFSVRLVSGTIPANVWLFLFNLNAKEITKFRTIVSNVLPYFIKDVFLIRKENFLKCFVVYI